MAKLIHANGTEETVTPQGPKFTLDEVQGHVGGLIERVYTCHMPRGKKVRMFVDEEGLMKDKPLNQKASAMAGMLLVGDAFVMERGDHF